MVRVGVYGKGGGLWEGWRLMVRVGVYGKGGGFMVRVGGLW